MTIFVIVSQAKINETDTFGPGDDDEIQFDDIGDDDDDIDSRGFLKFYFVKITYTKITAS